MSENNTENENEVMTQPEEIEEKKPGLGQRIKESFHNKKFKNGAYTTAISAVVLAIILVINLFASKIDPKIDLSKESYFTLTDATKKYVKGLSDDITIYYMVQSGQEVKYIDSMLDQYDKFSKIKVVAKDPELYPKFASKYTDEDVAQNSVIVVDNTNNRSKYVKYDDMLQTQMDYQSYSSYVSGLDIEGQITSALQYVTTKNLPVMYQVSGHKEVDAGDTLKSLLSKQNVDLKELKTISTDKIPDDCSTLFIYAPQKDYTEDEVKSIEDYLKNGGKAMIFVDFNAYELPNFRGLLNYYGIDLVKGVVVETADGHYMSQMPTYIIPDYGNSDLVTDLSSSKSSFVVSPYSVGIKTMDDKRSTIKVDTLLRTSDDAYSKANLEAKTSDKEDGDVDGPFDIAVNVTETYNNKTTDLVVLGSAGIADDSIIGTNSLANYSLISSVVSKVAGVETKSLSIPVRSLNSETISLTAAQSGTYLVFAVVLLPVAILTIGIVITVRRRKK